ncbi:MAG TPA: glycosyltransferase [Actinocrinis sp.]|nr:glycosyltransferase [Actinocrinis sp.]
MTQQYALSDYAPPARPPARGADPRAAGANPHEALRHHVVTAVIVSHDGARWLPDVLEALLTQQRPVQRIIAVDTGSRDRSVDLLEAALGHDQVLHRKRSTGYGNAVAFGLKSSAPVGYDEFGYDSHVEPVEWIWLLHDDSAPAPDALGQLLLTAEDYPDAAVLGPKIRGWYDRRQLLEVGATVAANGRRWTGLERNEHDQGQHDETRPVLSVSSAGMLVRRDVWDRLRGFDRAISLFREDLDFCWRVNSAGYQVVIAPDAVIYHAEAAARERRRINAGPNRAHLLDRSHALYTVAVNRGTRFWPALWFRLILGSFFRTLGFVIAKSPGIASDELFALLTFAARPDRIVRGRAARRRMRTIDPAEIEQFMPPRGALARNAIDNIWSQLRGDRGSAEQDASRHRSVETGPVSEEAEVLETDSTALIKRLLRNPIVAVGGGLTLIAVIAARTMLFGGTLAGGALLPTPGGSADLWSAYAAGWHGVGLGSTSYAPPYLGMLAILSTVLFGKAGLAVTVLLIGSVPLAGLSASYAFRRVTTSGPLRIWAGYAYALLAVATGAIATGRLGTAVAVAVLPLVTTTATEAVGHRGRSGSTRSAWTCAFLLTIGTAFAPVTWVLALVFGGLSLLTVAWRTRSNIVVVGIRMGIIIATPIVVLVPWSLSLLRHPTAFLLETGLSGTGLTVPAPTPIGLLLGDPGGPGTYPFWIGTGLLLAALAALLRGTRRRVVVSAWSLALVGFGSAVVISGLKVTPPQANHTVVPWPGVSTAMLGLGLIMATVVGAEGAKERIASAAFGWRQPVTVLITGAAVLAPVAAGVWWLARGADGPVARVSAQVLTPFVAAEGQTAARPRTLLITPGEGGLVDYSLVRDAGPTLGAADLAIPAGQNAKLDALVGQLLSGNGGDAAQRLAVMDVGYVLVSTAAPSAVQHAMTGVPGLTQRSSTQNSGQQFNLWSVNGTVGRVTVRDGKGATSPTAYQCTGKVPHGSAEVCAGDTGATVTVPGGADGRTLILAEAAQAGWTATVGGQTLDTVTGPDGLQAWRLPTSGGTVVIGYHSFKHTVWLIIGGVAAAAATIMALPFGRRPDEEVEGEEAAELDAATRPGERPKPAPEPEPEAAFAAEPEPDPERIPEPEPVRMPVPSVREPEPDEDYDDEDAELTQPMRDYTRPGYAQSEYGQSEYTQPEFAQSEYTQSEYAQPGYGQSEYQQAEYANTEYGQSEYQQQSEYDGYQSGAYDTGQSYYQQNPGQYQEPYAAPEQYQSSGDYQTPEYEGTGYQGATDYQQAGDYRMPEYPSDEYGYQGDYYQSGQYPTASGQYTPNTGGEPSYEQYPMTNADPYASGELPYAVPEPRQPEEPGQPQYSRDYDYNHEYRYDPDGQRHGEQDGWNR